jgi:predicted glycoside hydrolase/deacetylase ChbG (UPF0249 family)
MKQLIINADDFGLTDGVNRAILEAHEAGTLPSTSLLVNAGQAAAATELPRSHPELGVGLHVNLTLGPCSADAAKVRSIVDSDGRLLPLKELFRRVSRGKVRRADVHREVAAQAAAMKHLGLEPTHWDAHEAVAFWPWLRGPAAAAARDAGIARARTPRIWLTDGTQASRATRWRWRLRSPVRLATDSNRALGALHLGRHFALPGWRTSANLVESDADYATRWRLALTTLPPGVSEAVVHPGYPDEELSRLAPGFDEVRATDLAVLLDPELPAQLESAGVRLIGFRNLPSSRT